MIPIRDLLNRIRWDAEFARGDFVLGYFDRLEERVVHVPFRQVLFLPDQPEAFRFLDAEGQAHHVPLHRVREVFKDGERIWHRPDKMTKAKTLPGAAIAVAAILTMFTLETTMAAETLRPGMATALVRLPEPRYDGPASLERTLHRRRSVREFSDRPLTLAHAGQLLWAAQGVTDAEGKRTAPSAGALYPLEVFLVAGRVEGIPAGVYRYRPGEHALARVTDGDQRAPLAAAALEQSWMREAPAVVVFAAVYERTGRKYGRRAERYVQIEAGHAAENLHLQSVALDLGTVVVGAFDDAAVQRVLRLKPEERPLCLMPVGQPRL